MFDFKIFVRSYKRSDSILKKTLKELSKQKDISLKDQLYIMVASPEEYDIYKKVLEDADYPHKALIVTEIGGRMPIKHAIEFHSKEGDPVMFMDDDLTNFKFRPVVGEYVKYEMDNLGYCFKSCIDVMERRGDSPLLGIDYTSNLLFKEKTPFLKFDVKRVGGAWFGGFSCEEMITEQDHEDDNIRTGRILDKFGGTYIFGSILADTSYGINPGGMQVFGRGASHERTEKTKYDCEQALKIPFMSKYFEMIYLKKLGIYSLKPYSSKKVRNVVKSQHGDIGYANWNSFEEMYHIGYSPSLEDYYEND